LGAFAGGEATQGEGYKRLMGIIGSIARLFGVKQAPPAKVAPAKPRKPRAKRKPARVEPPNESKTVEDFVREFFKEDGPPLIKRLRPIPSGRDFKILSYDVRPRNFVLAAAIMSTTEDLIRLNDTKSMLIGDILEIEDGCERIEVIGDICTQSNSCRVRRGVEGTVPTVVYDSVPVTLIGNNRTGAEIDRDQKSAYADQGWISRPGDYL
jgi:hypothetical protein